MHRMMLERDAMPAGGHFTAGVFAALLFTACSTAPEVVSIDETPQGAVYLTRTSDGSLQAAHPIKIDSSTIALILNGILARDTLSPQKPSASNARRVFSGNEVGYLAPLISEALRRAASNQQVGFRAGGTTGALYAYGRSVYVTLTRYGSGKEAGTLSFVPEAAKRPDTYLSGGSPGATLVIDYELLDRLPAVATVPASKHTVSPPPPPQPGVEKKIEPVQRESEIEALRKELEEIKKQLAEQQAERERSHPQKPAAE